LQEIFYEQLLMERGIVSQRHPILTSYLDKWAQDSPGKIALVQGEQGRQWMYKQMLQQVDHLAHHLWKSGLRPGDRLASFLPNSPENAALMWAGWKLGLAFIPLTNKHADRDPQKLLELLKPKMVVIDARTARIFHDHDIHFDTSPIKWREWQEDKKSIIGLPGLKHLGGYQFSYRRALFERRKPWADLGTQLHSWRPALILYPFTPGDVHAPMILCFEHISAQIQAMSDLTHLDRQIKTLVAPPLQNPLAIILGMLMPMVLGGTAVLTEAHSIHEWKSLAQRYQVNTLFARAAAHERSFEASELSREWPSLTRIFYPYPKEDAAANSTFFCKKIGGITFRENGGYMALQHPKYSDLYLPLSRISIREEMRPEGKDGREVKKGEKGEVCIHPPLVHGGFLTPDGMEAPKISRDGIFYTGLKGCLEEADEQVFLKIFDEAIRPINVRRMSAA